jgi:hypothetical protein
VYDHLSLASEKLTQFPYPRILADVCALLDRNEFSSFGGIRLPPEIDTQPSAGSFWKG